jgi:hypothetical protein
VKEQGLAVGERRGVNASGFGVPLTTREQLLEEQPGRREVDLRQRAAAAWYGAERAKDGGDRSAP